MKQFEEAGMTDSQFADSLRRDKLFNDLIIETVENGDIERASKYLNQDNERITKALEL